MLTRVLRYGLRRLSLRRVGRWSPLAAPVLLVPFLPPDAVVQILGPPIVLAYLLGAAAAGRATLRAPAGRVRQAWSWVLFALVLQLVVGSVYGILARQPQLAPVLLRPTLALRSLLPPALLVAMIMFPARPISRRELLVRGLDLVMVSGAVMLGSWYFILGPALIQDSGATAGVLAAAVAATDCMMVCGGVVVLLRGVTPAFRRPVRLLVGTIACLTVPDLQIARTAVHGIGLSADSPTIWFAWIAAYLSLQAAWPAAWPGRRARRAPGGAGEPVGDQPDDGPPGGLPRPQIDESLIPYVGVLLGYGLLVVAALRSPLYPWGGLTLGTIVMTGGVVVRQLLTLRENRRLAVLDHVTGMTNRSGLLEVLYRTLDRAERHEHPAGVLLLDLDGFKNINDTHGHEAGDEALALFARILRRNVLGTDVVARLGGDEFVIVLTQLRHASDAVSVAERILADLRTPRIIAGTELTLRTSIGITLTHGRDDAPAALLSRADRAMYDAKRQAGSRWVVHMADPAAEPEVTPA